MKILNCLMDNLRNMKKARIILVLVILSFGLSFLATTEALAQIEEEKYFFKLTLDTGTDTRIAEVVAEELAKVLDR